MDDKTDSLGKVPTNKPTELQPKSTQNSSRELSKGRKIAALIDLLALNYPLPPMSETQKQAWVLTYVTDLGGYQVEQIERACSLYRQNAQNKFMATSGALLALIAGTRTEPRNSLMRPTPDGGHQPWDGSCTCRACIEKTPRQGFYKASDRHHRQDEYDREQADAHFKSRIEPSKLDEAEMRLRNELINRIVMDNPKMDREMARRRVMAERTAILYPHNKFAVFHAKLFPQITTGEP